MIYIKFQEKKKGLTRNKFKYQDELNLTKYFNIKIEKNLSLVIAIKI